MVKKGIWFGKLEDGTEASISDIIMQSLTVVQAARVRLIDRTEPLGYNDTLAAAQYMRMKYPELNREEEPKPYGTLEISRKMLPEDQAAEAVQVRILPKSDSAIACKKDALQLIQKNTMLHPSSFCRLGWRVDVFHYIDQGDCVVYFIFSIAHSHADGVAMKEIMSDFFESYTVLLKGQSLPSLREMLPLYSALPRERVTISWLKFKIFGFFGWIASMVIGLPGSPAPKLLSKDVMMKADIVRKKRQQMGRNQYEGPLCVDFVELDGIATKMICQYARSVGITVGSLVHAALFVAISKRFFEENPQKQKLSLDFPISVNVRSHLQPPLPDSVLAPQQGDLSIVLETLRHDVEAAWDNQKKMTQLLERIGRDSRSKVTKAIGKPEENRAIEANILLASIFRNSEKSISGIQYLGDAWLSNVGLYKPTQEILNASNMMKIESTFTLNPTITPAYELIWCNSTYGGNMTISMVADETMGRDHESSTALLEKTRDLLASLVG